MKFSFKLLAKYLILILIGLCLPYIEFIEKNLGQLDYVIILDILKLFSLSLFLFFISYFLLNKFFKNISYQITIFSILHYIFFKFSVIKNFINKFQKSFDGEISILAILIIFYLIYKFRYKSQFIKFLNFYIFFYLIFISVTLVNNLNKYQYFSFNKKDLKANKVNFQNLYFNKNQLLDIKNKGNKNIYLVIFDGMTSLEEFNHQNNELDFDLSKTYNTLRDLNLNYIKNSKSVFTTSHLTFSSIFNLNPIVNPDSKQYFDRRNFFPNILLNENSEDFPILLNTLKAINYKFKWVGTPWADCVKYNIKFCLSYNDITKKNNIESFYKLNPNNNHIYNHFLGLSVIKPVIFNLRKIFFNEEKYYQWEFKTNDSVGKFLNSIAYLENIRDKNYFFYIHHMAPHWPYVYNEDCTERDGTSSREATANFIGYKKSYICVLKKIDKLMLYINKNDPNAIVIIQGDHGFEFDHTGNLKSSGFTKNNAIKRLTHFNAIKINDECKSFISNNIGSINAVRLALSCATNQKPKLIEEKSYVGFYETQKGFGKVFNLDDLK
jgi:hypothetical protein